MTEPPSLDPTSIAANSHDFSSGGSDGSYPFSSKIEGYDYEFVPAPDSRYECTICLLVLREPRQTPCGHRFCRDCILKWLRESHTRCPVDNEDISETDLFPDNFAKREIQNFTVKCPNLKQGCAVLTTVKELPAHQNVCPLAYVPCPNKCASVLLRRDLEQHVNETCTQRSLACPDCHAQFLATVFEDHVQACPYGKVTCDVCEEPVTRMELTKHTEEVCPKKVIPCSFSLLGCPAQVQRCELTTHLTENAVPHLTHLCHSVTLLFHHLRLPPPSDNTTIPPTVNLATAVSSVVPLVAQLSSLDGGAARSLAVGREAQQGVSTWSLPSQPPYSFIPPSSTSSLDPSTSSLPSWKQQPMHRSPSDPKHLMACGVSQSLGTMEASLMNYASDPVHNRRLDMPPSCAGGAGVRHDSTSKSVGSSVLDEQKLVVHDQKLMELQAKLDNVERNYRQKVKELSELEGRICNGQFYWKIRNYSRYQHEAERGETTALHSMAFYTAPSGGYKLCVRANLNGVDSARGSHLSLFIHFMQGEYDDVLDWPFSGRIVLSIVDQNECCELRNHVSETLTAKPNLAAFQKPSTPRNHKGFGYMEFLPLSALKHSTYVKNDTLIVKVHVLPNG